ncbi:MAG: 2-isopropylmalate synthase, partial [Geminicoccaceae bacterium]|nr:2-isopropylmalate synthase [Geminicoccaceae bacterium]
MRRPEERVAILDTTLRDGEQSPGCSMDRRQKLALARALAELGVDVIEAGFPAASEDDAAAVAAIAAEVREPTVAALARCRRGDVERAAAALERAKRPRLHLFLATSPLHLRHKLGMSEAQALEAIAEHVALARRLVEEVEFSAEDASRSEPEFLAQA